MERCTLPKDHDGKHDLYRYIASPLLPALLREHGLCWCEIDRSHVRCIGATAGRNAGSGGCGWTGEVNDLSAQACPVCDGRVEDLT